MTLPQARSQRKLPERLLELSESLLEGTSERGRPDPAKLRRSISTAYYALFSLLVEAGAAALAGTGPQSKELRAILARIFEHSEERHRFSIRMTENLCSFCIVLATGLSRTT